MPRLVSITGSSGKTGQAIVRRLVASGARVRALIHRQDREEEMRDLGAAEVVMGDLADSRSLEAALDGTALVYHLCPNMRADEVEIGRRVIDACRRRGVERLVFHSVLHPQVEAMPHHWKKMRVEEMLIESGVAFTVLQPAAYMQNVLAQWESVTTRGVFAVPYAASTRLGMVDLADVAEAAVRVLIEDGHDDAIYELAGTEVLDQNLTASILARAVGRSVRVEVTDRAQWEREARESGLSDYAVESLLAMFRHYERHGFHGNPRALEGLLGRSPHRFEQVVRGWIEGAAES